MIKQLRTKGKLRTRVFCAITAVVILLVLGMNLWLYGFAENNALYIDTSFEELYTLSAPMAETCDGIFAADKQTPEVTITFCADPDTLRSSADTRIVYFMALKLAKKYENVNVKTVNIKENVTAMDQYKTTSLTSITPKHIIFSTPDAYRITTASTFWMMQNDTVYSFQGEHRMVTMLLSLLSVERPTAYFITGHGETVYDEQDPASAASAKAGELYDLLKDAGLNVKLLDLSAVDAVPDDCVLLVLNNPTSDFTYDTSKLSSLDYQTELEKIDRYLIERQGAMIAAKDYALTLPNLETYLREWGFEFHDAQMVDMDNNLEDAGNTGTVLVAEYDYSESSYGFTIYREFAAAPTAARTVVPDTGYLTCAFGASDSRNEDGTSTASRLFVPFLQSYGTASSYADTDNDGNYTDLNTAKGVHTLVGVGAREYTNPDTADQSYSYVFCASSADFFSPDVLGNGSFGNRDVMALMIRNISRVDQFASIALGGTSMNSSATYGKIIVDTSVNSGSEEKIMFYMSDDNRNLTSTDRATVAALNQSGLTLQQYLRQKRAEGVYYGTLRVMTPAVKGWIIALEILLPLAVLAAGAAVCLRRKFK
ncbi:MAG: GldG family protein [Clostridia bacterium]|nr:GldG family protein [Clostridia bacterium]